MILKKSIQYCLHMLIDIVNLQAILKPVHITQIEGIQWKIQATNRTTLFTILVYHSCTYGHNTVGTILVLVSVNNLQANLQFTMVKRVVNSARVLL